MALPKFEKYDGTTPYVWGEYPSLPGDKADLSIPANFDAFIVEHKRNSIIIAREIIETKYVWAFSFRHITFSMIEHLQIYAQLGKFRFYPDSANPLYYTVYWITKFRTKLQRGGKYNLDFTLLQR